MHSRSNTRIIKCCFSLSRSHPPTWIIHQIIHLKNTTISATEQDDGNADQQSSRRNNQMEQNNKVAAVTKRVIRKSGPTLNLWLTGHDHESTYNFISPETICISVTRQSFTLRCLCNQNVKSKQCCSFEYSIKMLTQITAYATERIQSKRNSRIWAERRTWKMTGHQTSHFVDDKCFSHLNKLIVH